MPPLLLIKLASAIVGNRLAKAGAWIIIALALVGAVYAAYCWSWDRGRDHERAKWEDAAKMLEDADAAADAEARDVAAETKKDIDDANERAKDAAASSDDPLAAGLGELRRQGSRQVD